MGAKTGKHSKSPHSSPRDGAAAVAGGEKPAPQIAPTTTFNISVFGEPNCGKSVMTYTFAKELFCRNHSGKAPKASIDPESEESYSIQKGGISIHVTDTCSAVGRKTRADEETETQTKFHGLSQQFMAVDQSIGFILVFSLVKRETFEALQTYMDFILTVKETSTWPVVLVGTHVDSEDSRLVTFEEAAKIARRYDAKYYEIDSRNGDSVNEVFDACVDAVRARFNEK